MSRTPNGSPNPPHAPDAAPDLRHVVEVERSTVARRRIQQILLGAVAVSVLIHLSILIYLASIFRPAPAAPAPEAIAIEFAVVEEQALTEMESPELSDLASRTESIEPEILPDLSEQPAETAMPESALEIAQGGAPSLGGAGDDSGGRGIGGGAAGASFFGLSAAGSRFAYIVDHSGSMSQGTKMEQALAELARSIDALPDFASFLVVFYSTGLLEPPMQRGWMLARRTQVARVIRWLDDVHPTGGTQPEPAFERVFGLDVLPDAIFFLTDGEIPGSTAQTVRALNRGRKKVAVHTIAFGDRSSQAILEQIARESGGTFRYVPPSARP